MKSGPEIAQAARLQPILEITEKMGLEKSDLEPHGWYKAKVRIDVRERLTDRPSGKYIDVRAITPTPLGEGKTTAMVGLSQALGSVLGRRVIACVRQPSMGPTFGIKGALDSRMAHQRRLSDSELEGMKLRRLDIGVPVPALRRHAHHAGASPEAGFHGRRPGRYRPGRRSILGSRTLTMRFESVSLGTGTRRRPR